MMPLNDDAFLSRCVWSRHRRRHFFPREWREYYSWKITMIWGRKKKKIREKTKNDKEIATMKKRFRDWLSSRSRVLTTVLNHDEIVSSFLLLLFVLEKCWIQKKSNQQRRNFDFFTSFFRVLNETLNNTKTKKNRTLNRKKRRDKEENSLLIRVPTNTITEKKERLWRLYIISVIKKSHLIRILLLAKDE